MIETKILIDTVEKVKQFSSVVALCGVECEIIKGYNIIDARSVMGLFGIDLSEPVQLNLHSDNPELLARLNDWIVK